MEVYDFWIIALLLGLASYFILRMALNSATTGKKPKEATKPAAGAQQGKAPAQAKAAPAATKPTKDAPKKKADAADTAKKPAAKAAAKKEVVAAAAPVEDEEVLDTTPLTGDPAEIERLVSTHSLGSPDMDVDFKVVSPILLGQHKQRKQKKGQDAGHFPADAEGSDGEGQQEAEKAKAVTGKQKFSEKEAEKLRKQGFKVAGGSKGSPNGLLGEGGNRDEGPDPSKEFTGISCYAPGWEKKIEPKVDDAGRGIQVAADSKPKKMKRLPMPSVKPVSAEEPKEESTQPVGKPAAAAAHVDPAADQLQPASKADDDEDEEDDEVVLPDFALRHAVDKRSGHSTSGSTRGRGGRGGARGGRGGAGTKPEAPAPSKLNPAAPTFVPTPALPMPFGLPMPMPFLRPGFPMGVPFVPPPPPPPYTGGVKVGDNGKKGKGEKASDSKQGNKKEAPATKGGKSVPLPRSKQGAKEEPSGEAKGEGEVKPAEAPTISVRVGGKPAPVPAKENTSKAGASSEGKKGSERKGKDASDKGSRNPKKANAKSEEVSEEKKEGTDSPSGDASAFKTKPCRFFASPEGCRYGADCKFIHEAKAAE